MEPTSTPSSQPSAETRLTALLLGQLSASEAETVRAELARDPALRELHARLAGTIALVREVVGEPGSSAEPRPAPQRLSPARRDELLRKFRSVEVDLGRRVPAPRGWIGPMSLAASLVAALGVLILTPEFGQRHFSKSAGSKSVMQEGGRSSANPPARQPEVRSNGRTEVRAPMANRAGRKLTEEEVSRFAGVPRSAVDSVNGPSLGLAVAGAPGSVAQAPDDFEKSLSRAQPATTLVRGGVITTGGAARGETAAQLPAPTVPQMPVLGDVPAVGQLFDSQPQDVRLQAEHEAKLHAGQEREVLSQSLETAAGSLNPKEAAVAPANSPPALPALQGLGSEPKSERSLERFGNRPSLAAPNATYAFALKDVDGSKADEARAKQQSNRDLSELEVGKKVARTDQVLTRGERSEADAVPPPPAEEPLLRGRIRKDAPALEPLAEVQTAEQAFSTFSLYVTDVSFRLAAASLEEGMLPEPGTVRSEEFLNAFEYRDPEPSPGQAIAFQWERAQCPFAVNRDLLRLSVRTAAQGRPAGRSLNVVLVLDRSGSMERADRVPIVREALRVLATQLRAGDILSVITFSRTARLWADGVAGPDAGRVLEEASSTTPEGGTNLEEALELAYQTARKHFFAGGLNRVILLTDGAANLGNVDPQVLEHRVEEQRRQGIALDCFGVGWEGFDDQVLQRLSSHGDGRYGFLNRPEDAAGGFAKQLAGSFEIAAADVKVQVEFNPRRVLTYRQIGHRTHQLQSSDFRNQAVDAAELGAAEAGNALYAIQVAGTGEGALGTVRVRYKVPTTGEYREQEWTLPYSGQAPPLEQASPAMRLAAVATGFAEWLLSSSYGMEAHPARLLSLLNGVPEAYGSDTRPRALEAMIRQAQRLK